jgi:hypothetical protein
VKPVRLLSDGDGFTVFGVYQSIDLKARTIPSVKAFLKAVSGAFKKNPE